MNSLARGQPRNSWTMNQPRGLWRSITMPKKGGIASHKQSLLSISRQTWKSLQCTLPMSTQAKYGSQSANLESLWRLLDRLCLRLTREYSMPTITSTIWWPNRDPLILWEKTSKTLDQNMWTWSSPIKRATQSRCRVNLFLPKVLRIQRTTFTLTRCKKRKGSVTSDGRRKWKKSNPATKGRQFQKAHR